MAVCAALTGLLVVVLWPSQSFAAIVPACENDFVSSVKAPAADSADESCDAAARGDDIDNSRAAPICDFRGASAIAPPRLRGVSEARFERSRSCDGPDSVRAAAGPRTSDSPVQAPDTVFEHAVLPVPELVIPAAQTQLIEPPFRTDGPRTGARPEIFHPPR